MSELKNLASKMLLIMNEVDYIKKKGRNAFHNYNYAKETDVSAAFSKAMQKYNVFMFSSIVDRQSIQYKTDKGKDSFLITVKLEMTFIDATSGESFVGTFYGDGTDSGDKGIYKAMTGAQKYALMKTFLLETGDDPERDDYLEKISKEEEKKELTEFLTQIAMNLGTESLKDEWNKLNNNQKKLLKEDLSKIKKIAEQCDQTENHLGENISKTREE